MSSFKERQSFTKRQQEAKRIRQKYTDRVPVIVEATDLSIRKETGKEKIKFLVPKELLVNQFIFVIRERMKLRPEQGIFLYVNGQLPNAVDTMDQLDEKERDEDGFLYVQYCFENTFGSIDIVDMWTVLPWMGLLVLLVSMLWFWSMNPRLQYDPTSDVSRRLLVIAGTHGNESGVSDAISEWCPRRHSPLRHGPLRHGPYYRIDRIPYLSPLACLLGCRTTYGVDVNRMYHTHDKSDIDKSDIDKSDNGVPWYIRPLLDWIKEEVSSSDVVVDFHEARGEHRQTIQSMGNAIWPGQTSWSQAVATEVVRRLNQVTDDSWVVGQWSATKWAGQPTLREYCDARQIHYILIEVTGQGEGPSQKKQQVVNTVLDYFHSTSGQTED